MLIEKILAEFPAAKDLAYRRIFAGRTIFFDAHNRRLREFSERLILAVLILAQIYAREVGQTLKLTTPEKRIWDRHFSVCQ
jgi:hypothetical protein